MSNTRKINGWECESCNQLYGTSLEALECFNKYASDKEKQEHYDKRSPGIKLLVGHECIDCLKLHDEYINARQCCYSSYPEPKDKDNFDLIKRISQKNSKTNK